MMERSWWHRTLNASERLIDTRLIDEKAGHLGELPLFAEPGKADPVHGDTLVHNSSIKIRTSNNGFDFGLDGLLERGP